MPFLISLPRVLRPASCVVILLASFVATSGCQKTDTSSARPSIQSADTEVSKVVIPSTGTTKPDAQGDALAPVVEVQNEDYAQARSRFQTKLRRKGPAPQHYTPLKPPAGVTVLEYQSGDLRLKAWVNHPTEAGRKFPAVLFLHGGYAFDKDDWELTRPYHDAGFIILAPMLRGENGQPGSFTFFYDELDDVLAAAEVLSRLPYVNAKRMYVAGASAGGTLALLAAQASNRFRAAASFSASPDQALVVQHAKIDLPFDKTNQRELQLRSPLAYAASFKCPVRIYYATQDHFVLTSQRTAELAKQQGLDVDAVRIEGDHGSIVPPAIKQSISFFEGK